MRVHGRFVVLLRNLVLVLPVLSVAVRERTAAGNRNTCTALVREEDRKWEVKNTQTRIKCD